MIRWLAIVLLALLTACVHRPEREDAPADDRNRAAASEDVHAEVDALFERGELRRQVRDTLRRPPLSATKATAYSTVPIELRYASPALAVEPPNVEFYIFSMGQADAMLVIGPPPDRKTLLVDVGETHYLTRAGCVHVRDRVKAITGEYHVDYLVVSHYHMDHAGNPPSVSNNGKVFEGGGIFCLLGSTPQFFAVGTLIDSGPSADFQPPARILQELEARVPDWIAAGTLGDRQLATFGTSQIDLGPGVLVDVVATDGRVHAAHEGAHRSVETSTPGTYRDNRPASPNDFSVSMEISVGAFELFTAGDLSGAPGEPEYPDHIIKTFDGKSQIYTNVESVLAAYWAEIDRESNVEVYRANHHGSENSSTVDLLAMLEPEVVIYSCGGKYGHPSKSIADRVYATGADQLLTTKADWPNDVFPEEYGRGWDNPAGEIKIVVPVAGGEYTISSATQAWSYPIFEDSAE